mgnify:FL=1
MDLGHLRLVEELQRSLLQLLRALHPLTADHTAELTHPRIHLIHQLADLCGILLLLQLAFLKASLQPLCPILQLLVRFMPYSLMPLPHAPCLISTKSAVGACTEPL